MIYYYLLINEMRLGFDMQKQNKKLYGNAVVGQSGGPTSVINATLTGVIKACFKASEISTVYGMKNGMEGLLKENLIELSSVFSDKDALSLLSVTPASALGSCRLRLPNPKEDESVYERLLAIFKKYNIRYFFYIGGNDSMDTVSKINAYLKNNEYEMRVVGVPKTIDNDLVITDHTPGYGSSAKLIATAVREIAHDVSVYTVTSVTIVELMGRDAGWLTAASALSKNYGGYGADLVYLPEVSFDKERFLNDVREQLKKHSSALICVSEGIKYANGQYVSSTIDGGDSFNHKYFDGVGKVLENMVRNEIGCKVRSLQLSLLQRCSAHILSKTDVSESFRIGKASVELSIKGYSGFMAVFERLEGDYRVKIKPVDVDLVANKVKNVPRDFINKQGNNVTKKCIEYITPLILGEKNIKYENGMPNYFRFK